MGNTEKATPEENLVYLYGDSALNQITEEIEELKKNSNIPFDSKYIQLGISFIVIKAEEMVNGTREKTTLKDLVVSSYGEAAMYKYNVAGGVLS